MAYRCGRLAASGVMQTPVERVGAESACAPREDVEERPMSEKERAGQLKVPSTASL